MQKKRGNKPLNRYSERMSLIKAKIKRYRITTIEIQKQLDFSISYSNLNFKLNGAVGLHESEINAIEKIVNDREKEILKALLNV